MSTSDPQAWWRGAFIYQIYPRSYLDSNNDGIGDLPGIVEKLPYVAKLGADAIWISPFFRSPMKDAGYDVSDYFDVDPIFGTLDDFKVLVQKAHSLGLRVIIDQVLSHTSDQHRWFQESRQGTDNSKADWYVWAEPHEDGSPPNNWLSFFGGSAWTYEPRRRQYYFHNFLESQPDLNYHHPEVQEAVLNVLRFWLDLGVDGFRFDTVNMYFHDKLLRDNPPRDRSRPIGGMNHDNPRGFQAQVYNVNRPDNIEFVSKMRAVLDEYADIVALGELGSVEDTLGAMAAYTAGGSGLHMCYTADLLGAEKSPLYIRGIIEATTAGMKGGWPCWSLGNHDTERFPSRWGREVEDKDSFSKLMLAVLMCLRGSFCLYQGEELGLTEAELEFDQLRDPFGISFWPEYKGRDGCRTPMVWTPQKNGGFSPHAAPWLPVPAEHLAKAVELQEQDVHSVLHQVRRFQRFRKRYPALIRGDIRFISSDSSSLLFERILDGQIIVVAANVSDAPVELVYKERITPIGDHGFTGTLVGDSIVLPPWQAFFAEKNQS